MTIATSIGIAIAALLAAAIWDGVKHGWLLDLILHENVGCALKVLEGICMFIACVFLFLLCLSFLF